jgi:outer membrane immunogenic protein
MAVKTKDPGDLLRAHSQTDAVPDEKSCAPTIEARNRSDASGTATTRKDNSSMNAHRLLVAAAGLAATVAPTAPAFAETDWTGPYVAIHGGYAFQRGDENETVLFDTDLDGQFGDTVRNTAGANVFSPGFCSGRAFGPRPEDLCRGERDRGEIGIRAGYDFQLENNIVLGVVVGFTDSHIVDGVTAFTTTPANYIFRRELEHFYSGRVRAGYALDKTLIYATGGVNYGEIRNSFASSNTANVFVGNDEDGSWGYELGAGLERRITDKISIGASYTYREFTSDNYVVRATPGTTGPTHPFRLVNPNGTDFTRSADNFESNAFEVTLGYRF